MRRDDGVSRELTDAMRRAVDASPSDVPLRLHLAELELADGQVECAITTVGAVLAVDPGNQEARALMQRALGSEPTDDEEPPNVAETLADANRADEAGGFDWAAAEADLGSAVEAPFTGDPVVPRSEDAQLHDIERPGITMADVGGMDSVKKRLTASFLLPLKNPDLRQLYSKSLRGGLLMYGPPGCGKTFIARAVAGELGASFMNVAVADVLDPYIGASERNLHEVFQQARRNAPCVLFFDELDTLGQRRTTSGPTAMRNVVNQLLTELDGVDATNDNVFALAATNQPWQVDVALRRPGRFDRTVLVLPPDRAARQAIFRHYLENRPVEGIALDVLADRSEGLTGADIAYVCEVAAESALMDAAQTGSVRMIAMADLLSALADVHPSIGTWLESARNVVTFGEDDGTFAELRAYLKKARRL